MHGSFCSQGCLFPASVRDAGVDEVPTFGAVRREIEEKSEKRASTALEGSAIRASICTRWPICSFAGCMRRGKSLFTSLLPFSSNLTLPLRSTGVSSIE